MGENIDMKKMLFCVTTCISLFLYADQHTEVYKNNVLHRFSKMDAATDNFVKCEFANWENETFEVFEQVKDPNGIAIDLGGWIGTTSIWLSKNFRHVITVEPDKISLEYLKNNLNSSGCSNVTVCPLPVASTSQTVIFGPRNEHLNESTSFIKKRSDRSEDYTINAITLKQLIHDYVFQNENLSYPKITFIKCDIEGGEEDIIEDILHFAYHNNVKVYLSFHLTWWKSKKIGDFEYLFKFFKTNCPTSDICEYLINNPFSSLLFEPVQSSEPFLKRNMPAVVIAYNQPTFIKNMVHQLEKYTSDIIVIDNLSTFSPLIDYYNNEYKYTLLRQKKNFGHTVYLLEYIQKLTGEVYILTDPDLLFNKSLPDNFIEELIKVSAHFGAHKVGFALCIDDPDIRTDAFYQGYTIQEWEANAWRYPVYYNSPSNLPVYKAVVDTTFCVVNRRNRGGEDYRIAGNFTCFHIPWHKNFQIMLQTGEYETYLRENVSTCWFPICGEKRTGK